MSRTAVCNRCGKVMNRFDLQQEFYYHRELGYGSEHDGDMIELDLCCECIDRIVDTCLISPIVKSRFDVEEDF